jgi:hypothetical protein
VQTVLAEFDHDGIAGIDAELAPERSWNDELTAIDDFDRLRAHRASPDSYLNVISYQSKIIVSMHEIICLRRTRTKSIRLSFYVLSIGETVGRPPLSTARISEWTIRAVIKSSFDGECGA